MKALIGKKAPKFHAPAVVNGNEIIEDFSLEQYVGKKYVVMFFYPDSILHSFARQNYMPSNKSYRNSRDVT